jgi:phosphonate transport system ATP-binding protein
VTALELSSVGVEFDGHRALSGVTLTIDEGEKVAIVGPSGAGKSTLLAVCSGALAPTTGTAYILNRPASDVDRDRSLRRKIGVVHQDLGLVGSLKVVHNANAGRLGYWSTTRALMSLVHPQELSAALTVLDRLGVGDKAFVRTDTLSGGERQRVALARILLQEPSVVLADEPVASLDPARAVDVLTILTRIATEGRRALVVSLHDVRLARRFCDRVIGIRCGVVIFDLPAAEMSVDVERDLYEFAS